MNYILEISISAVMILFVLYELIRINIFKKDNNALLTGFISLILFGFGLYLWIKNGIILDYSSEDNIKSSHAELMFTVAIASVSTGFLFFFVSMFKFIIWKIKKVYKKNKRY